MDPSQNNQAGRRDRFYRNPGINNASAERDPDGNDPPLDHVDGGEPVSGNQAAQRQPQYLGGFTMIPPIESRRNNMRTMAQKELENLDRWKEEHRVSSVQETPERLGGNVTMAEARLRQFTDHRTSKLQKKLKKEEMDKQKRREQDELYRQKKDEQREKAERLSERRRLEDQRRREQLQQDHLRTTENFLQGLERSAPMVSSSATHTSSTGKTAAIKLGKSLIEQQVEHRRVNSAFLDKLEGRDGGSASEPKSGDSSQMGSSSASEAFSPRPVGSPAQHLSSLHLEPDLEQGFSSWGEEADPQYDSEWALMKLMSNFPDCSRAFLEDILDQCNYNYQQAHTLLAETLG